MRKRFIQIASVMFMALTILAGRGLRASEHSGLDAAEAEELREAQDPSQRIKVYVKLERNRLGRFETALSSAPAATPDVDTHLKSLLGQYIALVDEMKGWIDDQFDAGRDMRAGLRSLLDQGPAQIDDLHAAEGPSGRPSAIQGRLEEAVADMSDALNGASKGLAIQIKQFGELKQDQKAEAHAAKLRRKEEAKRNKEELKQFKKAEKESKHHKDNPDPL